MTLKEKVFIVAYCKMNPVAMTELQGQELSVGALSKVKFAIEKYKVVIVNALELCMTGLDRKNLHFCKESIGIKYRFLDTADSDR
jgi:hypothetical protein